MPGDLERLRMLIIVPAHNEERNLPAAIEDLRAHVPWADVVVVDDCSTDATADVAENLDATVLHLPCNLGVGGAVQTGYIYAQAGGYDVAVQFDGDSQHRADCIADLLVALEGRGADLVIGSRLLAKEKFRFHPLRYIGSRALSAIVSAITRRPITDPTSGFRAASRRAICFFAAHYPQSYLGDTAEAIVWSARQKMKIVEIPTRMRQRTQGSSAAGSFGGFLHTLRIILAVLVDCLEAPVQEQENQT